MVSPRLRQRPGVGERKQTRDPLAALAKSQRLSPLRRINIFHIIRTPHRKLYLLSFIIFKRNKIRTCVVCLPCAHQKPCLIKCYRHPQPTCYLHLSSHTGPSGTFIPRAYDYFSKTSQTQKPVHGDYPHLSLKKSNRGT